MTTIKQPKVLFCLLYLLLTACTLMVYWQVLEHDFINYDDNEYVTNNNHIHKGLTLNSVVWAFTSAHASNWHPLTWLSHIIDYQLYSLNPQGHHLTSLLFHIANTLLLFIILTRMTAALWQSALVAALFALHPMHVESVAWVAERKDVLSTFFMMLTIWAYISYVAKQDVTRYFLVLLFFALGLMSKPMLVTLPLVLLLLDFWPLARLDLGQDIKIARIGTHANERSNIAQLIWEKIPFFALALAASIITFLVQQSSGAVKSFEMYSLKVRITNALVSYVSYIEKMFWPNNMAVLYPHPGNSLPLWHGALAIVVLTLITILVIRQARRLPYIATGWFWYLITLVPVIGIVQVGSQAMADRYTYITLIGLFVIIAWGVPDLLAKWRYKKAILIILTMTVIPLLMLTTWRQVKYWQNGITLFEHTLSVTKNNYLAHNNMGLALNNAGKNAAAIKHFKTAISIMPNHVSARNNLASALMDNAKTAEAFSHYYAALKAKPDDGAAHNNIGVAFAKIGNTKDAIAHFKTAIQLDPNYADAHYNLGTALFITGQPKAAISHYETVIRLEPRNIEAHYNLGTYLYKQGNFEQAIIHYRATIQIDPDNSLAHYNLGVILFNLHKFKQAATHFSEALRIKPDYKNARNNLAIANQLIKQQKPVTQ